MARRLLGENPSQSLGLKKPVEQVSWDDCQEFLKRLGQKCGATEGNYRLPTAAQWQHACRAGSMGTWCFGDNETELGDYAWYKENSEKTTHPVGQKKPNAWGLYDIHGNVAEWCADWRTKNSRGSTGNPPSGSRCLACGGCFEYPAGICQSAIHGGGPLGPGGRSPGPVISVTACVSA